jgi:hypothetical protein
MVEYPLDMIAKRGEEQLMSPNLVKEALQVKFVFSEFPFKVHCRDLYKPRNFNGSL